MILDMMFENRAEVTSLVDYVLSFLMSIACPIFPFWHLRTTCSTYCYQLFFLSEDYPYSNEIKQSFGQTFV